MGGPRRPLESKIRSWQFVTEVCAWIHLILSSALLAGSLWVELCDFGLLMFKLGHFFLAPIVIRSVVTWDVTGLFVGTIWAVALIAADVVYSVIAIMAWLDCAANPVCNNIFIPFLISNIIVFTLILFEALLIWKTLSLRGNINKLLSGCIGRQQFERVCNIRRVPPPLGTRRFDRGGDFDRDFDRRDRFDDEFARSEISSSAVVGEHLSTDRSRLIIPMDNNDKEV